MEVAIGSSNGSAPFQREVREWQRVDPNTGALLTGRLEADRWTNGPLNAYGKVSTFTQYRLYPYFFVHHHVKHKHVYVHKSYKM